MPFLTHYLAGLRHNSQKYQEATENSLLEAFAPRPDSDAGRPLPPINSLWVSQIRLCAAHAYPRFIASLIARIPFDANDPVHDICEKDNQQILAALTERFAFYIEQARYLEEGDLKGTGPGGALHFDEWHQRKETRAFMCEMALAAQGNNGLQEGLIFLWTAEQITFSIWTTVMALKGLRADNISTRFRAGDLADVAAQVEMLNALGGDPAATMFKTNLGEIINGLGIAPNTKAWTRAEEIWHQVVELMADLWPRKGEEKTMRKQVSYKVMQTWERPIMIPNTTGSAPDGDKGRDKGDRASLHLRDPAGVREEEERFPFVSEPRLKGFALVGNSLHANGDEPGVVTTGAPTLPGQPVKIVGQEAQ